MSTNPYETEKLKGVMVKEHLTWRSTSSDDTIVEQWNSPGTPAYYVFDPQGVIRYKWVGYPGEKALDGALEKLIKEAE